MMCTIILAGGNGRRLGGVFKPGLRRDGFSLLHRLLIEVKIADATLKSRTHNRDDDTSCEHENNVVLVQGLADIEARTQAGLDRLSDAELLASVFFQVDEIAAQGPLAALRNAIGQPEVTRSDRVRLLAADLPLLRAEHLVKLGDGASSLVSLVRDESGLDQYLFAVWRTDFLRECLARLDGGSESLRDLYVLGETAAESCGEMAGFVRVYLPSVATEDLDFPEDAARLGISLNHD